MTHIFTDLPHTLGVYTLTRLIEQREISALYEARQTHVDRAVVLEVLQPGLPREMEVSFMAQARNRVACTGVPHVADVLESLRADGLWFLTQERPQGRSLADIARNGETLTVREICCVIAAAADMYQAYGKLKTGALLQAASSIYVEESGEVHFLSPQVEGKTTKRRIQMQALAQKLMPLCPREKAQGIGRAMTLLEWLGDGMNGRFLKWHEIGDAARTVITQLDTNAVPDSAKPYHVRMRERIRSHSRMQLIRGFFLHWGIPLAAAASIIAGFTALGSFFGMGAPQIIPAAGKSDFLCRQADKNERVLRYPVSVQQYADFMRWVGSMTEVQRAELFRDIPETARQLTPTGWKAQTRKGTPDAAVTGVTYWQALAYARYAHAELPTPAQLQTIRTHGATLADLEWTRDTDAAPLPGIYDGTGYLLVDKQGNIRTAHDRNWQSARCGFRISHPDNQE